MKSDTSSLELYYIVKELQSIIGSKVNKVYQKDKDLLFDFFKSGEGRIQLRMVIPSFMFITKYKADFGEPPKFCVFLRKRLNNAILEKVEQHGFERILEFTFAAKDQKYIVIVELFSKGNVVVCDEDYKIVLPLQPQAWSSRKIRGGAKYEYPPEQTKPLDLDEASFEKILKESKYDSVVKTLAVELGLGGVFAEEACARAKISKETKPGEASVELLGFVKDLFNQEIKANFVDDKVFPFELKGKKGTSFASFNEAIDEFISKKKHEELEKEKSGFKDSKLKEAERIIKQQEEKIERMKEEIDLNKRKGELLFERYQEVSELFKQLHENRKKLSWKEIKEKYKDHKVLKEINEKEGSIIVDIE